MSHGYFTRSSILDTTGWNSVFRKSLLHFCQCDLGVTAEGVDSRPCLIGIAEEVGLKLPQTLEAGLYDSLGVTFKSWGNKEKTCFELASEKSRAFLLKVVVNLHLNILSKVDFFP